MQVENIADDPLLIIIQLVQFPTEQSQRLDFLANIMLGWFAAKQAHDHVRQHDEGLEHQNHGA